MTTAIAKGSGRDTGEKSEVMTDCPLSALQSPDSDPGKCWLYRLTSTFNEDIKQVIHLLAGTAILLQRASAGLASYFPGELPPPAAPLAAGSPLPQGQGCFLTKMSIP